jgi:WD40 repeat protein
VGTADGAVIGQFGGVASARAYHAQFSPVGDKLALVHEGNLVRIYEPGASSTFARNILPGHKDIAFHLAFNANGTRLASASYDGNVIVWDLATATEQFRLEGHTGELLTAVFTPTRDIIGTAGWDDKFRVWNARTGALVFESELGLEGRAIGGGPRSPLVMVASGMTEMRRYNPDVSLIVAPGPGNSSVVFDTATWRPRFILGGHTNWVWQQEFSPDGTQIVSHAYQSKSPKVWDAATGNQLFELTGHTGDVHLVKFSYDSSMLVTASFDGTARLWDAKTGRELHRLEGHTGGLASARFSRDDRHVVTGSIDQTARLWDTATGALAAELRGHGHWVINADFSANNERIMTTSLDDTVKIWDLRGRELVTLRPESRIFYAAWSPDNRIIATALADGTTRLWEAADWRMTAASR